MRAEPSRVLSPKQSARRMKGVGFVNVRAFVRKAHSDATWQKVLSHLSSPTDRQSAEHGLAIGWYEVASFARLLRAVDAVCGNGDLRLLPLVGAAEAEQDFGRVLRVFLRTMSPGAFLSVEKRLWKHFQDSGDWSWSPIDNGIRAVLKGWEADEALCLELAGYLSRVIEYTGGTRVSFTHPECRARGQDVCTYLLYWE
jgi:hypothetical protein